MEVLLWCINIVISKSPNWKKSRELPLEIIEENFKNSKRKASNKSLKGTEKWLMYDKSYSKVFMKYTSSSIKIDSDETGTPKSYFSCSTTFSEG